MNKSDSTRAITGLSRNYGREREREKERERERDERHGKNLGAFESLIPDHSSSLMHLCISVLGSHRKTLHLSY